MTSAAPAPSASEAPRHQRSMRNYLIDSRFQLKYAGYLVGITLVISVVLGIFLWRTSDEVVAESKKVSDVVKMSIREGYADNPELSRAFTDASSESDQRILHQQRTMLTAVVTGLSLLVVLVGLLGIYFTHKVAGPIFKMKRLLKEVGEGRLAFAGGLRKGDELRDFFEAFQSMVDTLRSHRLKQAAQLESAIAQARAGGAPEASLLALEALHERSTSD